MTITSLLVGKLVNQPEQRTGPSGKTFTTARMSAGADDESVLASVIAFGTAGEQLAALTKGDTIALVGRTKPKAWMKDGEPKAGLDVVADQLLTAYHLKRKRAAMAGEGAAGAPTAQSARHARSGGPSGHPGADADVGQGGDDEWLRGGR